VVILLKTVIEAILYNFCFRSSLKSATDHCKAYAVIRQSDRFRKMHKRTLHVSQHCLYENCKKKKEQWSPNDSQIRKLWRYHVWPVT